MKHECPECHFGVVCSKFQCHFFSAGLVQVCAYVDRIVVFLIKDSLDTSVIKKIVSGASLGIVSDWLITTDVEISCELKSHIVVITAGL